MSNKPRLRPVFRPPKNHQGFTIIEMVVAIVVIGVGLAGVLSAVSTSTRASADPMLNKQLQTVAEEIMEEILLKPYSGSAATKTGCVRNNFNSLADYAGYATTGRICDADGVEIADLAGFSLSVAVDSATLGGVTDARKVTVTVSRGSESFRLTSWRTNYAS